MSDLATECSRVRIDAPSPTSIALRQARSLAVVAASLLTVLFVAPALTNGIFAGGGLPMAGQADASFNGSGHFMTSIGGESGIDEAHGVAIDHRNRIVVVGQSSTDDQPFRFAILRYTESGEPATDFGNGTGIVLTSFGADDAVANAVAVHNGKIIVAGFTLDSQGKTAVAVARYNDEGTPDQSFNGDGQRTYNFDFAGAPANSLASAVYVDPAGRIVIAGYVKVGQTYRLLVARLTDDGGLDREFAEGLGYTIALVAMEAPAEAIAVGGGPGDALDVSMLIKGIPTLRRLSSSGGVASVGNPGPGYGVQLSAGLDRINAMLIQDRGAKFVAGVQGRRFAVARYLAGGELDVSFGGGTVTTDFGSDNVAAFAVAIQCDGKVVAAGQVDYHFAVVRYEGDPSWRPSSCAPPPTAAPSLAPQVTAAPAPTPTPSPAPSPTPSPSPTPMPTSTPTTSLDSVVGRMRGRYSFALDGGGTG